MKMYFYLAVCIVMLHVVASQDTSGCQLPNCNSCENKGPQCLSCPAKKFLNNKRDECLDCPTNCVTCTNDGKDVPVCAICGDGYYVDADACAACIDNCKKCSKTTCNECNTGFSYKDASCQGCVVGKYKDSKTGSCKSCPNNAESCSDDGTGVAKVIKCKAGYVSNVDDADTAKSSTICYSCPSDCTACDGKLKSTSVSRCTTCKANLYLTDGVCGACDTDKTSPSNKCKECDDAGKCSECNAKYVANAGDCTACKTNCFACSIVDSAPKCDTCVINYGINKKLTCDACPSNCKVCAISESGTTCTTCKTGFIQNNIGICTACPLNCPTCTWVTSKTECTVTGCETGYAYFATDKTCGKCPDRCTVCEYTTNGVKGEESCTTCSTGFIKAQFEAVAAAGSNINRCYTIPTGCNIVVDDADTADDAAVACKTSCLDGFWINSLSPVGCSACVDGCKTCSAATVAGCTACLDGYAQTGTGTKCYSCSQTTAGAVANCKTCSVALVSTVGTITCTACNDHFKETATPITSCKDCPAGCDTCTYDSTSQSTTCTACLGGYVDAYASSVKTGKCNKCPTNCAACTSTAAGVVTCTDGQCTGGTVKNAAGQCEACPENCQTCGLVLTAIVCSVCKDKYGLTSAKECKACAFSCKTCAPDAADVLQCSVCVDVYGKNELQCAVCPANCDACDYESGTMTCTKCAEKNTNVDGGCQKCPANCDECSSISKCTKGKCTDGFGQDSAGACVACSTMTFNFCNLCTDHPGSSSNGTANCTSCLPNYKLKDELQYGPEAACIDVSSLQCGTGIAIADKPPQCAATGCSDETTITTEFLCARTCYVCGDVNASPNPTFVNAADCLSTNGSDKANPVKCTTGGCYGISRKNAAGSITVASGCLPASIKCEGDLLQENNCKDASGVNECKGCCATSAKCLGFLENVKKHGNNASTNVVSFLMILIITITSGIL